LGGSSGGPRRGRLRVRGWVGGPNFGTMSGGRREAKRRREVRDELWEYMVYMV